jgi:hypothetical protein
VPTLFLALEISCQHRQIVVWTSNHENKGYMPLVQAFNHALHALHEVDVSLRKLTRESTDLLLFHRNDPKNILSMHDGCCSSSVGTYLPLPRKLSIASMRSFSTHA